MAGESNLSPYPLRFRYRISCSFISPILASISPLLWACLVQWAWSSTNSLRPMNIPSASFCRSSTFASSRWMVLMRWSCFRCSSIVLLIE